MNKDALIAQLQGPTTVELLLATPLEAGSPYREVREELIREFNNLLESKASIVKFYNLFKKIDISLVVDFPEQAGTPPDISVSVSRRNGGGSLTAAKEIERIPSVRSAVSKFFDTNHPCFFDGCEELRIEFLKDVEDAGGDDAPSEERHKILAKYATEVGHTLQRHRRAKRKETLAKPIVKLFLDVNEPCFFDGCEELRKQLSDAIEAAGGDTCPGCTRSSLETQFAERAQAAWDKQNPTETPQYNNEPTPS